MLRVVAIAAMFALAVPNLAAAQAPPPPGGAQKPRPRPIQPHGVPGGVTPHPGFVAPRIVAPHPGPVAPGAGFVVPRPGVAAGPQITYRGRMINRIHAAPFVYPNGGAYRRWAVGAILPPLFLAPAYFYTDWATLGLEPPQPGFQWMRYGPDLVLVNVATGEVADVVYGVFY